MNHGNGWRVLAFVAIIYLILTVAMTWPLAAGLARDVPGDFGDSLLNMWILGWGAEQFPRVDWNANIFHPEPLALAFSEHLFGQVLQILPVYYLTDNLILCYNLLFLSTFVLSGVGMYLLVHDITGDKYAAFLAGLIYAFVPFRVAQIAHIQTISSQWMPFALYGFRRYINARVPGQGQASAFAEAAADKEAWLFLFLGTAAVLMQNWSCGYYLIFFAPFVALFVVHQIIAAGRLRDVRLWMAFAAAAVVVFAGTWPFLALYLDAQRVHNLERPLAEVVGYSADVFGYLTAPSALRLWGPILQMAPKPEGEVFLGFVPVALALLAFARPGPHFVTAFSTSRRAISPRRVATWVLAIMAVVVLAGVAGILLTGGFVTSIAGIPIRATNAGRSLGQLAILVGALMIVSRETRVTVVRILNSPAGLAAICLLLAMWLSLGPSPQARGQRIPGLGLYGFFYDHVPGFDSLRVPARYAMVAALYLAMLAGIGAAWLLQRSRRAVALAIGLAAAVLVEFAFVPMPVNQTWGGDAVVPPARVEPAASAPAVYRQLASLPGDMVIAEFPFGDPAWELRYVYYSTVHWKPILNGYSGGFPQGYTLRVARLQRVEQAPEDAWRVLVEAGTTHVIVHEAALSPIQAGMIESWLEGHGARVVGRFEADVLYDLPRN